MATLLRARSTAKHEQRGNSNKKVVHSHRNGNTAPRHQWTEEHAIDEEQRENQGHTAFVSSTGVIVGHNEQTQAPFC